MIDLLLFTLERIRQHRILVLWVVVGLSVATTLALGLSLYVDSVYSELLKTRLDEPPYAFRYRYLGAWSGNITPEDVGSTRAAIQERLVNLTGLPAAQNAQFVRGGNWTVRGPENQSYGTVSLGTLEGAEEQQLITAGEWPPSSDDRDADAIPVLLPEEMFYQMGLQVGDELVAQRNGGETVRLKVAALWKPTNPDDKSWIFPPKFFDQVMLVQAKDLARLLEGIEEPIDEAAWWLILDGSTVRTTDIGTLLDRITAGQRSIENVLPGIRQDLSPTYGLKAFNKEVQTLTRQLFVIIAPVGGLVMYFVAMVAGMLVSRQGPDDVKLRSRGMSRRALLTVHILMWLILVSMALGVGLVAGPAIVRLVGRTTSFLQFNDSGMPLEIVITSQAILTGAVTGLIGASSGLVLAWRTTGQNINSFRRAAVRTSKAWWQRAYIDLALMLPAGYVLYTLTARGGVVTDAETPFNDPLVFVGPTLFALAATLLFLRVWPRVMQLGAWGLGYSRSVALLMTLRELTRSNGRYRGGLLMMAFTLSLTGFTASMASTLDESLVDRVEYQAGADLVLMTAVDTEAEQDEDSSSSNPSYTVTGYNLPPMQELLTIDGIKTISRVGKYAAQLNVGTQRIAGTYLGMDRGTLGATAYFRDDYANTPLGNLLNRLAEQRTGVLINRKIADEYQLKIGQEIALQVQALDAWYETRVPVLGYVDYFPTLDPNEGFFVIGNLDPIFELVGTTLPYDLWLGLSPEADAAEVRQRIEATDFPVPRWVEPEAMLREAYAEPARRGVLGFLSVGFVASIALTLIAVIIQSAASFRAQVVQLGALRAMGLRGTSVGLYVVLLQGLAALSGILSGTMIGIATTLLYLPLLDFSGGLPPYLVRVAWGEIIVVYGVFASVLFGVTMITTLFLSREQVAAITRLGDA
ncbi:MAG TPA: hypothetical protein VHP83_01765 [Aggregatilineaceae bacterium]|nr:hypothetical protein [Aggregatilineaceae bacterium]